MVLVRLQQVELAFGDHVLLDKVDLDVQSAPDSLEGLLLQEAQQFCRYCQVEPVTG